MKSNTKQVRDAVKNLIIEKGANNILNLHITEVVERIGCTYCDVQNAMSYFRYSPQQAKFREPPRRWTEDIRPNRRSISNVGAMSPTC